MEPLRFVLLGIGAGAAYGLMSQGLVLIYRGAGIINFAQGAIGMVSALIFFELRDGHRWPLVAALVASLTFAAAVGVAVHLLIMRPLSGAAPLVRLISTLAILVLLLTVVEHLKSGGFRPVREVMPSHVVRILHNTPVGLDRFILFGVAVAATVGLALVYRLTGFGRATTAVAENTRSAAALGISPDRIAAINWAAASALAALAAVLISSLSGAFNPETLTLLVIPGLAAALVGGFASFPLALAGGLAIGVVESEMGRYVHSPGWAKAGPFLVIIVVLVARGRPLPLRGEVADRAARLGSGTIRLPWIAAGAAVVLSAIWLTSTNWVDSITTTALAAIVLLSLVVVAGYAGQLSLAQYALAGMGAWVAARLVAGQGLPFEVAAAAGIAVAVLIGVVVGLAALRSRGVNLAIATLGAALVLEQVVLLNSARTGGTAGTQVGNLRVLYVNLGSVQHPQRFATFVILVLAGLMALVANLRRSNAGRRLVAMRANERAAASLGVGIFGAKLYAFGLSSAIAAVGGILIAFRFPDVVFSGFTVLASITAVMRAVVGGVGYVAGVIVGGMLEPGSIGQRVINAVVKGTSATFILALVGGVGALVVLITQPDGVVSRPPWPLTLLQRRQQARRSASVVRSRPGGRLEPVPPARLDVSGLTVRFGAVRAVNDVSISVAGGEVVGLIGPNGSGKTTLIDAVTGFVAAEAGTVSFNGVEVTHFGAVRRSRLGLGRTFQALELFPGMTVSDNLRVASDTGRRRDYFIDLVHPGRSGLSPTALAVAQALELNDELEQRPEDLPFGRRRLVAIARAVAARPSVLLLDEPAAGLGPEDTVDLGRLVRRLADELGLAVLVVEHDINLVTDICDRVVVLDRGSVIGAGPPRKVLEEPAVALAYLGTAEGAEVGDRHDRRRTERAKSPTPVLAARKVDAGYGALAAVRQLDLDVHAGEVVALLGPNGAGKTTTLLTLAGALAPLDGDVLWDGVPVRDALHQRVRRGLGLVTEERCVFAGLSTEANLRLGRAEMARALELFPELVPLRGRRGGLLSGGEQQMLALARVLAAQPRILLADELSLGLAPIIVNRLFRALRDAADLGAGVLVVEQYTQRALEIADRVYVLNRGAVVLEADASALRDEPDRLRASYLVGADASRPGPG